MQNTVHGAMMADMGQKGQGSDLRTHSMSISMYQYKAPPTRPNNPVEQCSQAMMPATRQNHEYPFNHNHPESFGIEPVSKQCPDNIHYVNFLPISAESQASQGVQGLFDGKNEGRFIYRQGGKANTDKGEGGPDRAGSVSSNYWIKTHTHSSLNTSLILVPYANKTFPSKTNHLENWHVFKNSSRNCREIQQFSKKEDAK